ncbi:MULTISPECIES: hypothetical protein [unclassified Psychrobacillus]|uniref:hypothetical protein n=1 Tax=unclassified Psychrobacillus TaxID=2636677 RepID=UPI0030F908D4
MTTETQKNLHTAALHYRRLLEQFYDCQPDDQDFLESEESEEVVASMEEISTFVPLTLEEHEKVIEILISFNGEWLPESPQHEHDEYLEAIRAAKEWLRH